MSGIGYNEHLTIMVYGFMDCGDEPQEMGEFHTLTDAVQFMRKHETTCHPDLILFAEDEDGNMHDSCYEPPTLHKAICEEYWDRGLECQCIPEDTKQALRDGANPDDVM